MPTPKFRRSNPRRPFRVQQVGTMCERCARSLRPFHGSEGEPIDALYWTDEDVIPGRPANHRVCLECWYQLGLPIDPSMRHRICAVDLHASPEDTQRVLGIINRYVGTPPDGYMFGDRG